MNNIYIYIYIFIYIYSAYTNTLYTLYIYICVHIQGTAPKNKQPTKQKQALPLTPPHHQKIKQQTQQKNKQKIKQQTQQTSKKTSSRHSQKTQKSSTTSPLHHQKINHRKTKNQSPGPPKINHNNKNTKHKKSITALDFYR